MKFKLVFCALLLAVFLSVTTVSAANTLPKPCAGQIDRLTVHSPQLDIDYTVDVWTPADYVVQATNNYPVVYMNDGQSLFDSAATWNGQTWDVDDMITRLHKEGITENAIIVGIHSNSNRFGDYSPTKALEAVPGLKETMADWLNINICGDEYLSFIVNTLKPLIEQKYRVRTDLHSTSIMGSSMGGLISAYAICEYPEVFGNAACLSTHWIGTLDNSMSPKYPEAVIAYLDKNLPLPENHRLYFDHGTLDLDSYYEEWNSRVLTLARSKGYVDDYNLMSFIDNGATHNEYCWGRRLNRPFEFILGAATPPLSPEVAQFLLPSRIPQGLILHCFCWQLKDIIAELPQIAAAGFKAVQTSPMQRAVQNGDVWYDVYRPADYRFIDNGMGTREDMRRLCEEASLYGIKVIVDIVANHGTGPEEDHDPWWDENGRMKYGNFIDWSSRWSETHEQLGGYGESNSDDPDVQERTRNYILELKALGVSGLRWDAAKHIGLPSEGCNFWPAVLNVPGIWSYGEILGTPAEDPTKLKEYADLMWVTNTNSGLYAGTGLEWMGITPDRLLHWVESHDTFSNGSYHPTQDYTPEEIDRQWAITAARFASTALYFSRPYSMERNSILVGNKGRLDFTRPTVAAANHFHNAMGEAPEQYYENQDVKAIYRTKGVVIVKKGGGEVSLPLCNLDPELNYEDEITGKAFRIENGNLIGTINPDNGVAVVYDYKNATLPQAYVIMEPEIKSFAGETCSITLRTVNSTSATYSVDGEAPVTFSNKATFTIGEGVAHGSDIIISWTATASDSHVIEGSFTVTKEKEPEPVYVYLNFDDEDYGNFDWFAYVYTPQGNSNAGWPGSPLTLNPTLCVNDITGTWYEYAVPENLSENGMAMVSSSNKNYRYPGPDIPGIPLEGESLVFTHRNGVWTTGRVVNIAGIDNVDVDALTLPIGFGIAGAVRVNYPGVEIYDITGRLLQRVAHPGIVELSSGIYILRRGLTSKKVAVN